MRNADDKPGVSNLLQILAAVTGDSIESLEASFEGKGYGAFKQAVADAVIAALEPVQTRYQALISDKAYLNDVLQKGADAAQKRAYKTLAKVYRKAGFVERPRS